MEPIISDLKIRDDVVLITIRNLPGDISTVVSVFDAFASDQINIDLISQSPLSNGLTDLSFTVSERDLNRTLELASALRQTQKGLRIDVNPGNTKITVYGEPMRDAPGCAAKIFRALRDAKTDVRLITTSEVDVSILIPAQDEDKTVSKLSEVFALDL